VDKALTAELQLIGAELLARLTAEAISTFNKEVKVPRKLKKELTTQFALVVMSYYYQIEDAEALVEHDHEDADDDEEL